ncbi:MAG: hypothetical protein WDZ80_04455 [Candidatus Paceibacterota bacterium]
MKISKETNEETTTSTKTSSETSDKKEKIEKFPNSRISDRSTGIDSDDEEDISGGEDFMLTPTERSRKKFFDQKASFFRVIKWGVGILLTLFGIIATVLAIFYAYNISNIAEPIGGIKVEIEYLKKDNKDAKDRLINLENRVNILPQSEKLSQ